MADNYWRGTAIPKAQSEYYTFGGTWETDDLVVITINGKSRSVSAGSTTITTVIDTVVADFNGLSTTYYPEFYGEITASRSGSTIVFTSNTPGKPFTLAITTTEANGGAADAQTISSATVTQASKGPNHWDDASNWSAGTVPASGENVYLENSAVDILYGLDQNGTAALGSLNIARTYTGKIGLPDVGRNSSGITYREYREKYLIHKATLFNLGYGTTGAGSSRIRWNGYDAQTTMLVTSTGRTETSGIPAFQMLGTHASNALTILQGDMGVAVNAGEVSTLATIRVGSSGSGASDVQLTLGSGVTATSATVTQAGGTITSNCAVATWNMLDGTGYHQSGALTTLVVDKGNMIYTSTGTLGTLTVGSDGDIDFSRDPRARAITNTVTLYERAGFWDPLGTISGTPAFTMTRGDFNELKRFSVGINKTLTRS